MAKKAGDWGSNPALVRDTVHPREVTRKALVTEPEALPVPGEAPKLRLYSWPGYDRQPDDPDFKQRQAKGTTRVRHGR